MGDHCPIKNQMCCNEVCAFWLQEGDKQGCTLVTIAKRLTRMFIKGAWPLLAENETPIIAACGEMILTKKEKEGYEEK